MAILTYYVSGIVTDPIEIVVNKTDKLCALKVVYI